MPVKKEQIDDARRQGQFEGQVLTKLSGIDSKIDVITTNYTGLESRLRVVETGQTSLHDLLSKSISEAHGRDDNLSKDFEDLKLFSKANAQKIRKLEDWRIYILGAAAVIAVLAEAIYQYFVHH